MTALVVEDSVPPDNTSAVLTYSDILLTLKSEVGYVGPGFAYISGLVLFALLTVMFIFALPFVRRNGYFQVKL